MKKKIKGAVLISCMIFFISGCKSDVKEIKNTPKEVVQESESQTQEEKYISKIETDECFVCGNSNEGLMPYYEKRDSVGIIHWNTQSISDTNVRAYDDNGNELFQTQGMSTTFNSFGDGYGSVVIQGMPERGITDVEAHFSEKDTIDFEKMENVLCQKCLNKVIEFYEDQKERNQENHLGTTGFALVDFMTKELYTLSDPYRGYMIRDYYVQYEIRDNEDNRHIDLTIFYAPERTKK